MTDEQVLQAVIDKAVKNGWEDGKYIYSPQGDGFWEFYGDDGDVPEEVIINGIITSVEFAKALWGEEEVQVLDSLPQEPIIKAGQMTMMMIHQSTHMPVWKFHLQRLVIAENRIEYLKQFIEKT